MTMEINTSAKSYAEELASRFQFLDIDALEKIIIEGHRNCRSSVATKRMAQDEPLKNTALWEKTAKHLSAAIDGLTELSDDSVFFDELIEVEIDPELHPLIARLTDLRAILVGPHEKRGRWLANSPIRPWVFKLASYWENEKQIPVTQYFEPAGDDGIKRPAKDNSSSKFVFEVIEHYEPHLARGVHHALCAFIARRKYG